MKRIARVLLMVMITYGLYLAVVYSLQTQMLFPGTQRPAPAWRAQAGVERWERPIEGGSVEALFAPNPQASPSSPAPLLVFTHGNGGLADDSLGNIPTYHGLGFSVLIPEYRGFGRSAGQPGEEAIVDDVVHFVARAKERPDVDDEAVVYHGQSLGGGVAAAAARRLPPNALILESTFTSVRDFAARFAAPSFLVAHPFDTRAFLADFEGPVLLMHATDDKVVPYDMGVELSRIAANVRFVTFEGGWHVLPPPREAERYWTEIRAFLEEEQVF